MPDLQKLYSNKESIINTLKMKGPSFPTRIARETGISPLFVAALLAELVSERRVKLSNMKVGSSPVYYLEHQILELENFIEFLNNKEKEAFLSLKEASVLEDQEQHPAIRVALRKLKDFAIPTQVRIEGDTRLFWRYFALPESETKNKIEQIISGDPHPKEEIKETIQESKPEIQSNEIPKVEEKEIKPEPVVETRNEEIQEIKPERNIDQDAREKKIENIFENKELRQKQEIRKEEPVQEIKREQIQEAPILKADIAKPKKDLEHEFPKKVKQFLDSNAIDVKKEISNKKKEFVAKVSHQTRFGPQEFLLTAKEKKKITQDDLTIALQNAQTEKMPALVISPGKPDKKALSYAEEWRNLVKFQELA